MTNHTRWNGIVRPYGPQEVDRLRPSVQVEHTLARRGAERLWDLLHAEGYVRSLGALTGNQAVQQVQAGLKAIYVSGWQGAGDAKVDHMKQSSSKKAMKHLKSACNHGDQVSCGMLPKKADRSKSM